MRRRALMEYSRGEGIHLDLEKMGEDPGPYSMSYGFDLDVLCESIRKVGLINPPLVARNQAGSFDVVSGYRRILALKALGERKVFCLDVTTVMASPPERLLAAFYENLATRRFNDMEKAIILHKLKGHVRREEILASFMPLLSLPSHEGTLKFYLKLLTLDDSIQKAIAAEQISIKVAKTLVEMEEGFRQALFQWISVLKLNLNQQIKFVEYIEDIRMRDGLTDPEMLSDEILVKVLENPRLNNPQKAKAVLETLRVRRFPRLAQAQQAIASAVSAISMPPETSIHYDPYLEDPYYHLDIKFKHGKQLRNAIDKLCPLRELEAIPELWAGA
jgi:ParB family transcriptional regulator, chromosome partitioning protein